VDLGGYRYSAFGRTLEDTVVEQTLYTERRHEDGGDAEHVV
jgi:hypothetical protein